jgi:hypothetical protein
MSILGMVIKFDAHTHNDPRGVHVFAFHLFAIGNGILLVGFVGWLIWHLRFV